MILLHGRNSGIGERDWHMHSNLLSAVSGADLVVVMPQGDDSYYINAARKPKDRYEDYVVGDLISDVEANYRVLRTRDGRGIGGVSMGGWGALNLGMRHPEMFSFVASLSGPLDITERAFSWRRFWNSIYLRSVFGPKGSGEREQFNPYRLERERSSNLQNTYFFLSCGTKESLLEPNRRMARAMKASGLNFVYKEVPEAHGWENWNQLLPEVIREASARLRP
jgi:S-formylglutathione hydrolase FrmB